MFLAMYTIAETEVFKHSADLIWRKRDRLDFIAWLAANPLAGDVIQGSGGLRKIRWSREGIGEQGGTRVIYYNLLGRGCIWLLIAYTKSKFDDLPAPFLKQLKAGVIHGR